MDHVSYCVTVLALALTIGCEVECKNDCHRRYTDCTRSAQTTDQRQACELAFNACYTRCPQGPQQPQWDNRRDE
jgi:hypothetical protein